MEFKPSAPVMLVQSQARSSVTTATSSTPQALPPYSRGTVMLTSPSSRALSNTAIGKRASRSHCAAIGLISRRANSRAVCCISFCSSVSSKFIALLKLEKPPTQRRAVHRRRKGAKTQGKARASKERAFVFLAIPLLYLACMQAPCISVPFHRLDRFFFAPLRLCVEDLF